MAKLALLRRALTEQAEQAERGAASGATIRERYRDLGRADAYRHALALLTNAEQAERVDEPELPVLTVTETPDRVWATFQDGQQLWTYPTLEHAFFSLRSMLLRDYAPRTRS